MTQIQKVLLKGWFIKTSIFLLALIGLLSFNLLKYEGGIYYTTKTQFILGESFVFILLLQFLLSRKCWYSWITIFLLLFNQVVNICYICTDLEPGQYGSLLLGINYGISIILSIAYFFTEIDSKKTTLTPVQKISGGVAIGKKPTHTKEYAGDKVVFIDLSVEGRVQYDVFALNSNLFHSDSIEISTDYNTTLDLIVQQVNQL